MTNKLTELLAETKAIVEAATSGPWFHQEDEVMEDCSIADRIVGPYLGEQVCAVYVDSENEIANADFIAHARNMMPALIEALELAVSDELIIEAMNKTLGVSDSSAWSTGIQLRYNLKKIQNQALADIIIRKAGDK